MKKRYIVRFMFTGEFQAENDSEALGSAAIAVRYGVDNARHLELKVVAAIPLADETHTDVVAAASEAPATEAATKDDMPF